MLIESDDRDLSLSQQCALVGLSRSSYYYEPCREDPWCMAIMKQIDQIFTMYPFYGKRRISVSLQARGYDVGVDLARTFMKRMGIEAIYAKPNLSKPHPDHKVYPYLLRGVKITKRDQVWSTDITYLPMKNGFLYLTAVLDWYSRFVLAWRLSNSLEGRFCREVLEEALMRGKPDMFNTDQGGQYTSMQFTSILEKAGVRISMDGRGRALDNVWVERLWRTVKQEEVYIHDYSDGADAYKNLEQYFNFYNEKRPHSALGYVSPGSVYRGEEKYTWQ